MLSLPLAELLLRFSTKCANCAGLRGLTAWPNSNVVQFQNRD